VIKLPPEVDINNLIDDLRIFSWEASEILLNYAQIIKDSDFKSKIIRNTNAADPVTLADLKVNEVIINNINEKYKNINWDILSEENVKFKKDNISRSKDFLWILDPLDGTKDFIQGTGNYAMHLALNYKNRPYIGIVLIPSKDELWISNHEMVWCENRQGTYKKPNLSKKNKLEDMIIVTSKNHRNKILEDLIRTLNFKDVVVMGSIGCKIASILRGESDIYISLSLPGESSPKDWDFSAPEAALKAAGGAITNINNEELTYGNSNFEQGGILIASSNKLLHKNICQEIKEVIIKYNLYPFDFN
tara:strand:+ start:1488 stop:2399 length:912 start_codon:yes stop_codon:yes gene_type:complete